MANGDKATLASLMARQGSTNDSADDLELDIEIAAPGTLVGGTPELPEGIEIESSEDGGVIIDFDPTASNAPDEGDFFRNLAEELDDRELGRVASELLGDFEANKSSRKDWEDAYANGLELLGFTYEERTEPFRGATGS